MIVTSRLMCTFPTSSPFLIRAFSRWEEIWDSITGKMDPHTLSREGISRHSGEICHLAKKVIQVSLSGSERWTYFRHVAHDSILPLHEFLRGSRDL
jgi:hypothetical protein